jgi:hypothetical protein
VQSYFDLQGASEAAARAQEELTAVTERYERVLSPLQGQLDAINREQQAIRDRSQIRDLKRTARDPMATASQRRLALLEIEEIKLRQQMSTVEDERDAALDAARDKLVAAQREEESLRRIFETQQAQLDQQIRINNLIAEENRMRKEQEREVERLYQATLQYNLTTASTEGKLALLRLELGRYTKGSVEYFGVLTQIAGLEEQLANERAGAGLLGPNSILPPVEDLDIPSWAQEFADRIQSELDKVFGKERPPALAILTEVPTEDPGFVSMLDRVRENVEPGGGISQGIKDFVDAIKELTVALGEITPPLQGLASVFGVLPEEADKSVNNWLPKLTAAFTGWTALTKQDWEGFWTAYTTFADLEQQEMTTKSGINWDALEKLYEERTTGVQRTVTLWLIGMLRSIDEFRIPSITSWGGILSGWSTALGQWLTDTDLAFTGWLQGIQTKISEWDLGEAGRAWIKSLYDGAKDYWDRVVAPWWENSALGRFVDLLPGSEPKDPSSPLRGLEARGAALMENLQRGIDSATLTIAPPDFSRMAVAGAGGSSRTGTVGTVAPTIVLGDTGGRSDAQILELVRRGIIEAFEEVAG